MTSKEQVKKEFNEFAEKIQKLEVFRAELNALDTAGFEQDEKLIRAKLKDTNAIPQIQRELGVLKRNIEKKGKGGDAERISRQISNLKSQINKKRKVSGKKQLTKDELKDVREIPKLENDMKALMNEFKKHTSSAKIKVDSGVGLVVDSRFDDFVQGIKGELSKKIREKESTMDSRLRHDIEIQKGLFSNKYKSLVKEFNRKYRERVDAFHQKYKDKVDNELKEEVKRRFRGELNEKLDAEKRRVVSLLLKENAQRLDDERKRMGKALHSHYAGREDALNADLGKKRALLKSRLAEASRREEELIRKAKGHDVAIAKIKKSFEGMKAREKRELAEFKKEEMAKLDSEKERANAQLQRERLELLNKRKKEKEELKKKSEREKKELRERKKKEDLEFRERKKKDAESLKEGKGFVKRRLLGLLRREKRDKDVLARKEEEDRILMEREKASLEKEKEKLKSELAEREKRDMEVLSKRRAKMEAYLSGLREKKLSKINEDSKALERNLEEARRKHRIVNSLMLKRKKELEEEREVLNDKIVEIRKKEEKRVDEMEKREKEKLAQEVRFIKEKLKTKFIDRVNHITKMHDDRLENEIAQREEAIRANLEAEFKLKLKEELEKKTVQLQRKKRELEKHVMAQAKRLFN